MQTKFVRIGLAAILMGSVLVCVPSIKAHASTVMGLEQRSVEAADPRWEDDQLRGIPGQDVYS